MNPVIWQGDSLKLLDQRLLPQKVEYITCHDCSQAAAAIKNMVVRGAPAIGVTAAYGVVLAARRNCKLGFIKQEAEQLRKARPTAVNLSWSLDRMLAAADKDCSLNYLTEEAERIFTEDIAVNKAIGQNGALLIKDTANILTHCNAGALATAGYGTALGVIRKAAEEGKNIHVYAGETRPYLQGARLTVWELIRENIPVTLIVDSAAAGLLSSGKIDLVLVGADRISANGDVINKVGTYGIALAARAAGVPFYAAAPVSTIDISTPTGCDVIIEERNPQEVTQLLGIEITVPGVDVYNPAFDRTPAELVTGIITEKELIRRPNRCKILDLLKKGVE